MSGTALYGPKTFPSTACTPATWGPLSWYTGPEGYTAEFTYLTGGTRVVVDLRPDQVRPERE